MILKLQTGRYISMIEKLREKERLIYILSLFIFISFFTQFLNFPNKILVFFGFFVCVYYLIIQRKNIVGLREILLLISMLLYIWFSGRRNFTGISIVLLPVLLQMWSRNILSICHNKEEKEKRSSILLGVFVVGYMIHALLNVSEYWGLGFGTAWRYWNDFWTGYSTPATQHSIYFLPVLAISVPALLYLKKNRMLCMGVLALSVFSLWFSAVSQSRTPLLIFLVVLIWEMILLLFLNKKERKCRKVIVISICFGLAVFLILSIILRVNWDFIQTTEFYRVLNRDGGIFHNVRFEAQKMAWMQLLEHPFGGYQMDLGGLNFAHNLWLDTANAAGIIPFILLVCYTIFSVYDLFRLLKEGGMPQVLKYACSGLWLALMLYYMVEPALEASVQFIAPWTFTNGIIYEWTRRRI